MPHKTPQTSERRDLAITYDGGTEIRVAYRGRYQEFGHEMVSRVREAMRVMDQMSLSDIRKFLGL